MQISQGLNGKMLAFIHKVYKGKDKAFIDYISQITFIDTF